MDNTTLIILGVLGGILLILLGVWLGQNYFRRRRTNRLQEKFGPEYERTVNKIGDQSKAEDELEARLEHHESLEIKPLSEEEREYFASEWRTTQAKFVDQPEAAVREADQLIKEIMHAKGYPYKNFEQRAAEISVDHPELVTHYRKLRKIVNHTGDAEISTEEMRQAMLHCRMLYEELLENRIGERPEMEKIK